MFPLEEKLGMSAEQMLRALDRAIQATPMLLGILAEVAFEDNIIKETLSDWNADVSRPGTSHDFSLTRGPTTVTVQVKLQRSKNGQPEKGSKRARRWLFSPDMYKVEMQRSRGGERSKKGDESGDGEKTRPYRFGEFDILAVSMYPSSNPKNWGRFVFTLGNWLIPDPDDPRLIATFQPVPASENYDWTEDFEKCVRWLQAAEDKTIGGGKVLPKQKENKPKQKVNKVKKRNQRRPNKKRSG